MRPGFAVPCGLLAMALLLTGCAATERSGDPTSGRPGPVTADAVPGATGGAPSGGAPPGGATTGAVAGGATSGAFSPTDVAWLQLTVAMNERLLPVLDLVPARTTDAAWRTLAVRVEESQRADLTRSRALLAESGAPATNPHEGHDMPGMITETELTALRAAEGSAFHRLVARHLRAHLSQAVRIARAEQGSGAHPATTALAATVAEDGTAQLTRLDQLAPPVRVP
ncbi:DUF305 domain-containing protein [Micromonospora sp. 15K316]|uniref:DUF305 domain-containing protein n=1 Tax=Micromonospora sp. 15K316 TaxID=2530376 RepID=UPI00104975BA|nr:DUF305 domain-containing protein [Micromonospora sp. 15K316]TDC31309.1 DUF305 domain-containing protein [Micromonospora sp. 15K316]